MQAGVFATVYLKGFCLRLDGYGASWKQNGRGRKPLKTIPENLSIMEVGRGVPTAPCRNRDFAGNQAINNESSGAVRTPRPTLEKIDSARRGSGQGEPTTRKKPAPG